MTNLYLSNDHTDALLLIRDWPDGLLSLCCRVNLCLHPRLNNGGMYGGFATVAGTVEWNEM